MSALRDGSGYSPRQILVLIRGLPPESATASAIRGSEDFRGWGVIQYQMASLIDAVRENTFAFISANSKKKPSQPSSAYRPEAPEVKKPKAVNPFSIRLDAAKKGALRRARDRANQGE